MAEISNFYVLCCLFSLKTEINWLKLGKIRRIWLESYRLAIGLRLLSDFPDFCKNERPIQEENVGFHKHIKTYKDMKR